VPQEKPANRPATRQLGNFWTIRSVATDRYLTGTSPVTLDHSGFKNGTNLFLISPLSVP